MKRQEHADDRQLSRRTASACTHVSEVRTITSLQRSEGTSNRHFTPLIPCWRHWRKPLLLNCCSCDPSLLNPPPFPDRFSYVLFRKATGRVPACYFAVNGEQTGANDPSFSNTKTFTVEAVIACIVTVLVPETSAACVDLTVVSLPSVS